MGLKPPVNRTSHQPDKPAYDPTKPERFAVLATDGLFYSDEYDAFGDAEFASLFTRDTASKIAATHKAGVVEPGKLFTLAPLFYNDK